MNPSDVPPLPPDVAAILSAAHDAPPAPPATRDAVLARVHDTLGLATPTPTAQLTDSISPAPATVPYAPGAPLAAVHGVAPLTKIVALVVTLGSLASGLYFFAARTHASQPRGHAAPRAPAARVAVGAPSPPAPTPPVAAPPSVLAPATTPALSSATHAAPPRRPEATAQALGGTAIATAAPSERDDSLRAERTLLEPARLALSRGDGAAALRPLLAHERRFPRGRLAEERDAMRVQALVLSGRRDAAREAAARFRRASPRSVFLPVLDAALREGP